MTYFLFHPTDIHDVAGVLKQGELLSPHAQGRNAHSRMDRMVKLYFRPRTPDQYHAEGFRTAQQTVSPGYTPIPVYLLFDLESLICHPEARFSEGDPAKTKKTYKTPAYFRDMPFECIYHDSWFMPDEREEILRCREAQVILPERLGLESLELIWLRSEAEYEALHYLLGDTLWREWHDKITCRNDFHLFHNHRVYVRSVALMDEQIQVEFNPARNTKDAAPFRLQIQVAQEAGETFTWQSDDFDATTRLHIDLPESVKEGYQVQILLNGELAYGGKYVAEMGIV